MSNSFYVPGEHRAKRVEDLFATIAPSYDLINDLQSFGLHRFWKRRLIRLAQPKPAQRALDLCCGTGDLTFLMAELGAQTTGVDFSLPMLRVARERSGFVKPAFVRADALKLPFEDSSFDLVTISYGLRNLASVEGGLIEMHRILKSGGHALILDFGKPGNLLLRLSYYAYLRAFVPLLGRLFFRNSATHAYIYQSLVAYPAQEGVAKLMKGSGWKNVRFENLFSGIMSINLGEKN